MISDALIALLYEKRIESVTVKELCDRAQVSRRTFYRHFADKNGAVADYIERLMRNLALELREIPAQDKRSFIKTFFEYFIPYSRLFLVLNNNGLGDIAFTGYIKYVTTLTFPNEKEHGKTEQGFEYSMAYMLGGLWSLLTYWIMNGCQKTPEELTDIVCAS